MQGKGIVYKHIFKAKSGLNKVTLFSDNEEYAPYPVALSDIVEMWQFACGITSDEPNSQPPTIAQVIKMLERINLNSK